MTLRCINAAPVIIIGAGRSGTNMLRDVLAGLDGVETWPCDEINYIWRHGNRDYPTDQFTAEHATEEVVDFIRKQFASLVEQSALSRVLGTQRILLEKTCANSLRVPFVNAVLPEAKYIHIVRDGRDVVASALERWTAPLDIPYLLAKARYVPSSDLPYYASRYLMNRLSKVASSESALSVWGPKFDGMQSIAANQTLEELCATQWVSCVESASRAFEAMPNEQVFYVRYEDFVREPEKNVKDILEFLNKDSDEQSIAEVCAKVSTGSVGRASKGISKRVDRMAEAVMGGSLSAHQYC